VDNALSVTFISENRFVLLTQNTIVLYEIFENAYGDYSFTVGIGFVTANPRITHTDPASGTLLIIGGDESGRLTNLFLVDGENLTQLSTSDVLKDNEQIDYAIFKNNQVVMKTQNAIHVSSGGQGFITAVESTDNLVVLSLIGNGFIYAKGSANGEVQTFVNTQFAEEEIDIGLSELGSEFTFRRSHNASNFAVIADGIAYIWNAELGRLTDYGIESYYVEFHRNSSSVFHDGSGNWYMLNGTEILPATEVAQETSLSSTYKLHEITRSGVKIEIIS
jgi:hypothetical protein